MTIAALGLLVAVILAAVPAVATTPEAAVPAVIERGARFLISQQQPDGSWEGHVGLTAVVLLGLMPADGPGPPTAPEAIARGLAYLERWRQPDGGIYQQDLRHYTTAVGVLALARGGMARQQPAIAAAREFLLTLQAREDNGFTPAHPLYGGTLVDGDKANLDATFFAMRALAEAGLPRPHPYWARALRFVSRCQNWRPGNDQPWAAGDGGFVFAPGFSFAGATTSYGSMTYAGLGAYHDAGLGRDDPRVAAALGWVSARFTADDNPGLQKQTLYHSYFYAAQALRRWNVDTLRAGGRSRAWGDELTRALLARQLPDGAWVNTDDPRWWESRPVLATAFAVRALKIVHGLSRP